MDCPYRGLFPFYEQDAGLFFGRDRFLFGDGTRASGLVKAVQSQSLVAVIGSSGSGKSSVVFAGLIPFLRRQKGWIIDSFRPFDQPFYRLASSLIRQLEPKLGTTQQIREAIELANDIQSGRVTLSQVLSWLTRDSSDNFLLVIDQFEEIYTVCSKEEQDKFIQVLLDAIHLDNFKLLLTIRADFYGYILALRPFRDALQRFTPQLLGSMNRKELQLSIEKPLEQLDIFLEEKLTQRILDDVGEAPGNLPLLQFALTRLWSKQRNKALTHIAYEEIGGVKKALANHAEEIYNQLSETEKNQSQRIFVQLVRPGEGTEDTRRLATSAEVGGENWELVVHLASPRSRLVVTSWNDMLGVNTVEVVHEALIKEWQRLREWMSADREFRRWQESLRFLIHAWKKNNRDKGALLRGSLLAEAEGWLQKRTNIISLGEKEFIQSSRALQEQEIQIEKELRKRAEVSEIDALVSLSQAQILLNKQLEALITAVKAGRRLVEIEVLSELRVKVIDTLWRAVYGINEINRLQWQHSRILGVSFSPDGRMIAAAREDKTVVIWQVNGKLHQVIPHDDWVWDIAFSPDGTVIASACVDKKVRLWDLAGNLISIFEGHDHVVLAVSFSPEGKVLASASADNTIKLWSLDGEELSTLHGHDDRIWDIAFSPHGRILASASADNTIKLWSLDGSLIRTIKAHTDRVFGVSFSPDGCMLASASWDKTVRLWDLEGRELQIFAEHADRVMAVRFSPNGKILATATWGREVKLWHVDGTLLKSFLGHDDIVWGIDFSPDSKLLASACEDNTVRVWSVDRPDLIHFQGHTDGVNRVRFSPDSKMLFSVSDDKTIKLWNSDGSLLNTLQGHTDSVWGVDFNSYCQLVVSSSLDKTIRLWSVDGSCIKIIKGHESWVWNVRFSPDGTMFASASEDSTIKIWNLDGSLRNLILGHSNGVNCLAFSPDSKLIVSGAGDRSLKLWNIDGEEIQTFQGHTGSIWKVIFSPDGQMLASASNDRSVRLWLLDGTLLQTLTGHTNRIRGISFSPDGQTLASASEDNTIKLWRLSGEELLTLRGHSDRVWDVDFSSDGQLLASASSDKSIKLWDYAGKIVGTIEGNIYLELDSLLRQGCEWLENYLNNNPNVSEPDRYILENGEM